MPLTRLRSRSFHGQDTVHGKGQTRGDGSGVVGTGVGGRVGGQGTARGHWCVRVGGQCRDPTVAEVQRGRPFVSARGCTPKGGPVNARRPHSATGTRGRPGPRASPSPAPRYLSCFSWPASPWPREGRPQRGLPQPKPSASNCLEPGGRGQPRPRPRRSPGRPAGRRRRAPPSTSMDPRKWSWSATVRVRGGKPAGTSTAPGSRGVAPTLANTPARGPGGSSARGRPPGMAPHDVVTATAPTAPGLHAVCRFE